MPDCYIKFFGCQNHNSGLRKCSKTHYIRVEFLERVVLYEINRLACFANEYEDEFVRAMMGHSAKVTENDLARKQRELDGLLARDTTQHITIYYNYIGAFPVPNRRNIPEADITMGTRKGVAVSYSPEHTA